MELLLLDLGCLPLLLGQLVVLKVFNGLCVDEAVVYVLLLLSLVFLALHVADLVLALDEERVNAFEVALEQLDELELVGLPGC